VTVRFPRRFLHASGAACVVALTALTFFTGNAGATTPKPLSPYTTGRANSGTPNSTVVIRLNGSIVSYGNSAITYKLPSGARWHQTPTQFIDIGHALFQQNCASCHGNEANGIPADGTPNTYPDLQGVGPAAVDFWIESGRMPAKLPTSVQAIRGPQRLNHHEALEIAAWIDTLTKQPGLPYIPTVNVKAGNVAEGASLFALNCAACHTITGGGDALAFDTFSPALRHIPAFEVAEAIRTGPGNMPRFSGNLTDSQVRDIVQYVTEYIEHPENPGGLGLGGLGPVAEGFIGLALGVGLLCLAAFWVGERE
jgi:ubiquinol-cytochrome c reductase cytochrome c subunit